MALVTLAQAKKHLRIDTVDHDVDIALKVDQASAIILRYLKGRRFLISSITSSGGLATVTTPVVHGLTTNNVVSVWGAGEPEYNGAFTVTVVDTTTFTYPMSGIPTSPATGVIQASVAETWTALTVPQDIQSAVLLMVTHLFEHRGDDLSGGEAVWTAIERLLVGRRDPALA